MKYVLFLTDGSNAVKKDAQLIGELLNASVDEDIISIADDKQGIVADIYSNHLMSYKDYDVVILPSVTKNVQPELIAKKIKMIKNKN